MIDSQLGAAVLLWINRKQPAFSAELFGKTAANLYSSSSSRVDQEADQRRWP
jgi:hypothetical protein